LSGLLGQAFYKAGTSALNPHSSKGSSSAESIRPKSHSQTATINPREEVAVETEVEVQVEEVEEEEAEIAWYRQQAAAGDAAEDEARRPTMRRAPGEPTKQEIIEHNLTHLRFRSWRPCCVAGKAKQWPHHKSPVQEESEDTVPSIHMDYWFMRDDEVVENVTVINVKEKNTKMFSAHVVRKKGNENEEAARIIKDIEKMGSIGKIIVKTDQEPSTLAVAKEIKRLRLPLQSTILESSKIYDSQSNGVAERAVQSVECQARTVLIALQKRLEVKVPVTHKIVTWLVEHAADLLNKFAVGRDGRTAFERLKGKKYRGEVVEFGRKILYKIPCKPEGGLMTERWLHGIWLGKRFLSDEHLVGIEDGSICVSSSVRLMPESESWSVEWVNKVRGTPWCPKGSGPGSEEDTAVEVIPAGNPLDAGHPQPRKQREEGAPREVYITKEHIVKFGYTASCLKCRAMREGFQVTRGHSSLCRDRIMEALRNDEDSKDFLDKNEEKNQRFRARQAEDTEREEKRLKLNASRLAKSSSYIPEDVPTIPSSSSKPSNSSNNPSSSSKRGPDPVENTNRIVRPTSQEQRGGKRSEINVDEREVRATIPESRGQKRVSDNDGRIDLDEADMEMARKAAEAGLEILRKSVRIETVTPATYS